MEFFLLGPFAATAGGQSIDLGRRRERLLLALLLLDLGRSIQLDRLIDLLWDEDLPRDPRGALYIHMSRLRRRLSDHGADKYGVSLVADASGYAVHADPETIDVHRFTGQVKLAGEMDDPAERSAVLTAALALWRGEPLADLVSGLLRERLFAQLVELRRSSIETRVEDDLELGRAEALVPELAGLVGAYPTSERLIAARMIALYRTGRQQDALAAYDEAAGQMAEQFGLDPGPELGDLRTAILRNDPSIDIQLQQSPAGAGPNLLPRTPAHFTGRVEQRAALDEISHGDGSSSPVAIISTITGTGGVGKTALAVYWARSARGRFPDGQLYVNLRGYGAGTPLTPFAALVHLLAGLGVPRSEMPADEEAASARFRSILAESRALVILDNADSVAQVRPLLAGGPECMTVVTSRDRMAGLVAIDGARRVALDMMTSAEASALLAVIIGADRVAAEPGPTAALADLCGRLPLALRIAAATLTEDPDRSIAEQVMVFTAADRLPLLAVDGDPDSSIRNVLSHSYHRLDPAVRRMFRLVAMAPGADIGIPAAAALADLDRETVAAYLDQLCAAHLLEEPAPGRYRFHDLIGDYARELAGIEDSGTDRDAALDRVLDWYSATAHHADRSIRTDQPDYDWIDTAIEVPVFADNPAALSWFDLEGPNIATAIRECEPNRPARCWQLATSLYPWFERRTMTQEWIAVNAIAVRTAVAIGDHAGEAIMRHCMAVSLAYADRYADSIPHLEWTAAARRASGNPRQLISALMGLGGVLGHLVRTDEAIACLTEVIAIIEANPDFASHLGSAYDNIGYTYRQAGQTEKAVEFNRRAVAAAERSGSDMQVSSAANNLGRILLDLKDHDGAEAMFQKSLDYAVAAGHAVYEKNARLNLGYTALSAGRLDDAHRLLAEVDAAFGRDFPADVDMLRQEIAEGVAATATE